MISTDSQIALWLVSSLFWIGVTLFPLGLLLVLVPQKAMRLTNFLNQWISTQAFFEAINKPRYLERVFYRHHYLLGIVIVLLSALSIYMLVFYSGVETTASYLLQLAHSEFERWLFVNLYYILVFVMIISLLVGGIIIARPSALKKLEAWGNRWITTEEKLRPLDEMHDLPPNILSEKPRLFGLFVLLGATYIMYMTIDLVL